MIFEEKFTVAVEFVPPYAPNCDVLMERVRLYKEAGVETVSICSNPMAKAKLPALYAADMMGPIFRRIVHYPCAGRSSVIFRSDMMQAVSMGVDAILILAGDPHPECSNEIDVLARIRVLAAEPFTPLLVGAAADPNRIDKERLRAKRDAGAGFFMTQPIFDEGTLMRYLDDTRDLEISSLIGITVPGNRAQLETLCKIPGVQISEDYLSKFVGIQSDGAFSANAVAQAIRLIKFCEEAGCAGVYVSVLPSQVRYLKELIKRGSGETS